MSKIADRIRSYVNDQDVADHYGEWGILRRDQRRLIRELCDTCDAFERTADEYFEKTRWISVEERLPEDNLRCLVAYTGRHGYGEPEDDLIGMTSFSNGQFDMNQIYHFELNDVKIKYWMPLPKPPMKGGEE